MRRWRAVLREVFIMGAIMLLSVAWAASSAAAEAVDLTHAVIVVRGDTAPGPEQNAARVLAEEVEGRTGLRWAITQAWPATGAAVAVRSGSDKTLGGRPVPERAMTEKPEGFAIATDVGAPESPVVWISGADPRGALYGVGKLLRNLEWAKGSAGLRAPLNVVTAPAYRIRGHQLGYRARANSYDAWDVRQYEQYIRELAFFGANSIENIPFEDTQPSPVMKLPRKQMNREMSVICERYDLEYWVWTPATFDLNDAAKRAAAIEEHKELYADCPRLDGVFFPGGDPGDNHPKLVMPFLEDLSRPLLERHPKAKIWISLQGFDDEQVNYFYTWLAEHNPDWLGGVVAGPSSPPIPDTRARLPKRYGIRHYPDITHTVRCQYPTPWWDPAFAFTLGREPINPEPIRYSYVHNVFAPYTDGFLTYSDGMNDDVNKDVWSALGWDPTSDVRDVLMDYARLFFGPAAAERAADGILALERNWQGALATNGAVDATLGLWQELEAQAAELNGNWRWQSCLLRAYYDAYTRHRLLYETHLEEEANAALAGAPALGAATAMDHARDILALAESQRCHPDLRERAVALCDALFQSIGMQTSVEKYHASGSERGAVLDFIDFPLNNRRWLEDEFTKVRAMAAEAEKVARLDAIRNWENPGPGGSYDDIGNPAKSPHVIRGEDATTDPNNDRNPNPDFWDNGNPTLRQSWVSYMDWPLGLRYMGLDPGAAYVVRTTGNRDCLLRANGARVEPTIDGKGLGDIKEFPLPKELYKDGYVVLTFDRPNEAGLNWRQASRLTEVWLIRR